MKANELREKSDKELIKMLEQLESERDRASNPWIRDNIKSTSERTSKMNIKGATAKGVKTSLLKNIRKHISRVKTILREREVKHESL